MAKSKTVLATKADHSALVTEFYKARDALRMNDLISIDRYQRALDACRCNGIRVSSGHQLQNIVLLNADGSVINSPVGKTRNLERIVPAPVRPANPVVEEDIFADEEDTTNAILDLIKDDHDDGNEDEIELN